MLICPRCRTLVKVRQEWRYNITWFYIHCSKCGKHMKSPQRYRGESTEGLKEELIKAWESSK